MKQFKLLILLVFTTSLAYGQTNDTVKQTESVDTVFAYKVSYEISTQNGKKKYFVNDAESTKEEVEKIAKANKSKQKCNPCYLINMDAYEKPVSSGLYYFDCKVTENDSIVVEEVHYASYTYTDKSCKEGEWKYFDEQGNVIEVKYYKKDEELKTKANRKSYEK